VPTKAVAAKQAITDLGNMASSPLPGSAEPTITALRPRQPVAQVAKRWAYCPRPSFSSQSATCCIAAAPRIIGLHLPASASLPDEAATLLLEIDAGERLAGLVADDRVHTQVLSLAPVWSSGG